MEVDELYEQFSEKKEAADKSAAELAAAQKRKADLEARLKEDTKAVAQLDKELDKALAAEIAGRKTVLQQAEAARKKGDYQAACDLLTHGKVLDGMDLVFMLDTSGSMGGDYKDIIAKAAKEVVAEGLNNCQYAVVNFSCQTLYTGFRSKDDKAIQDCIETFQQQGTMLDIDKLSELLSMDKPFALVMLTDGDIQDKRGKANVAYIDFLRSIAEKGNEVALIYFNSDRYEMRESMKAVAEFGDLYYARSASDAADMMKQYAAHAQRGQEKPERK